MFTISSWVCGRGFGRSASLQILAIAKLLLWFAPRNPSRTASPTPSFETMNTFLAAEVAATSTAAAAVAGKAGAATEAGAATARAIDHQVHAGAGGVGLAAAGTGTTATYFRFYDNSQDTGASPTGLRFDGAVGTSSLSELQMTVTTIVEGAPVVINSFTYSPPRA